MKKNLANKSSWDSRSSTVIIKKNGATVVYYRLGTSTFRVPCKIINRSDTKTDYIIEHDGKYGIDYRILQQVVAKSLPKKSLLGLLIDCLLPENLPKGKRIAIDMEDLVKLMNKLFAKSSTEVKPVDLIYQLCSIPVSVLTMSPADAAGYIALRM